MKHVVVTLMFAVITSFTAGTAFTDLVPATRLSSSRPLSTAPAIPGIAPAAIGIKCAYKKTKSTRRGRKHVSRHVY